MGTNATETTGLTSHDGMLYAQADGSPPWYALHTRSRFEAKVCSQLQKKGIIVFLPRMQVWSKRRDRKKNLLVPMFPGYVFVQTDLNPREHLEVVKAAGAVRLIGINGRPEPVRTDEIENLKILDGTDRIVAQGSAFKRGDRVEVQEGPFSGLKGVIKRRSGRTDRIVASLGLLGRSVEVELDDWVLEKAPEH